MATQLCEVCGADVEIGPDPMICPECGHVQPSRTPPPPPAPPKPPPGGISGRLGDDREPRRKTHKDTDREEPAQEVP